MRARYAVLRALVLSLLFVVAAAGEAPGGTVGGPAYLVAAPDRGFLGNEETRDAFAELRQVHPVSALWIVTREDTKTHLRSALERLRERSDGPVDDIVVLPLFATRHHVLFRRARGTGAAVSGPSLTWADPFGESYLAEEVLFDRVARLSKGSGQERLVVVGAGAGTATAARRIRDALRAPSRRTADAHGLGPSPVVEVLYDDTAPDSVREAAFDRVEARIDSLTDGGARALVVPFGFARRYTTMMSDWNGLGRRIAGERVAYRGRTVLPHRNAALWLQRAATRHRPLDRDEVGVVLVPHGSDFNWNETMREGIAPLRGDYMTADAFSMVDPPVLERAVRSLEERGAKAAVVVRIFSLASSFREKAEYVLGLRREYARQPRRIRSPLELHTLGGLERTPRLVEALADRVRAVSEEPGRETVLLLGHGAGDEARNDAWMANLRYLAREIRARTDGRFRAYRHHTWREDWPDEREASVAAIRRMVREASDDSGTALVVPVRTAGRGPADAYLEGLEYRYATGFAPHPAFTAWLRSEIERGIAEVRRPASDDRAAATPGSRAADGR